MARQFATGLLLVLGLGAIVAAITWSFLVSEHLFWSQEQAQEYQKAAIDNKVAGYSHDRQFGKPDSPGVIAARERWEKVQSDLERARSNRNYARYLVAGFGLAMVALAAFLHNNRPPKDDDDLPPIHRR